MRDCRYTCDKCGTTMADIEQVNFDKFSKCRACKKFAIECWRFAVACAGEWAERILINGLNRNSEQHPTR